MAGAQLAADADLEQLYAGQLTPPDGEHAPKTHPFALVRLLWTLSRSKTTAEFGARMGRIALNADTPPKAEPVAPLLPEPVAPKPTRWLPGSPRSGASDYLIITRVIIGAQGR